MKADTGSGKWKWRKPTALGLAILCALAMIEAILVCFAFFPDPLDSADNGMLDLASTVIGSLLLICTSFLLTERTGPQIYSEHGERPRHDLPRNCLEGTRASPMQPIYPPRKKA
jgi:hypothetical protein